MFKKWNLLLYSHCLVTDGAAQEANEALLEENKRLRHQAEDLRVGH